MGDMFLILAPIRGFSGSANFGVSLREVVSDFYILYLIIMIILFVVQRIMLCKSIIEKDNHHRRALRLPTPSLEDFKEMRGLKLMKVFKYHRFMVNHGLLDPKKPQSQKGPKRGRGRGRPYPRGRGGRGGRGGFHPQDSRDFGRSPPSRYHRYYFLWNLLC